MSEVATATAEPPAAPAGPVRHRPRPVLHPFLFTIFPIVFLVARNTTDDIGPWEVLVPLVLALAVTTFVFGGLWIVFRDPHAAGFLTSGLVLLFFSFGHVNDLRDPNHLHPSARRLFAGYLVLAIVLVLGTIRWRRLFVRITPGLNLIAGVLVVLNLVPIVSAAGPHPGGGEIGSDVQLTAPPHPRDVYYIIFDRYADEITLRDRFGYDNTPFLTSLGDRGFDVVTDAVANYPKTAHSLASSLNMSFLDELVDEQGRGLGQLAADLRGPAELPGGEGVGDDRVHLRPHRVVVGAHARRSHGGSQLRVRPWRVQPDAARHDDLAGDERHRRPLRPRGRATSPSSTAWASSSTP